MKIIICDKLNQKVSNELEKIGNCLDISESDNKSSDLLKEISNAEIVVIRSGTTLTSDILEHAKELKIIARCGVGVDNIDLSYAKNNNILVTNSPAANLISVVELTVALIINASRKITLADKHVKSSDWNRSKFLGIELYGKTLGIIGFGKAGKLVSERMKAFGMSVVFYDPFISDWEGEEQSLELDELLKVSDVVSVHVVKTKETENLLSEEKLCLLKESAILVNTSRGGVIDEKYLVELLKNNKLFGAGLDVFETEPPLNVNEFDKINLVTTPHIGASTAEAQLKAGIDTVENIKKILSGDLTVAL
jgi:D-3-phosphoglycerate dehydrogenase